MDSTYSKGDQPETGAKFVTDSELGGKYTTAHIAGKNFRQGMIKVSLEGTSEQIRDHYNEAAEQYDEYIEKVGKDIGAQNFAKIVHNVQPNMEARILDVGCGTGVLGIQLKQLGYTNVDGLDFAQRMLDLCQSKGLYINYICASIKPGKKTPQVADNTYDVVCVNCSMAVGLITPECVPTLARMVKTGGSIVFNITSYWVKNYTEFGEEAVEAKLQSFVDSGVLTNWGKSKHYSFEATGEEAYDYIATVV